MIHRRINLLGLSSVAATSLLLLVLSRLLPLKHSQIVFWILVWAGIESVISFTGVSWSLKHSNRVFYSWFFGGSLVRLMSLGGAAWVVTALRIPPAVPLLSLTAAYFLLTLVQLPFISHGLR
jgi:hypothetical protein